MLNRNLIALAVLSATFGLTASSAHASPDRVNVLAPDYQDENPVKVMSTLTPSQIYERTEAVFAHFGVPAETDSQPGAWGLDGLQTNAGARTILPYLDPSSQFSRYWRLGADSLSCFQDRDAMSVADYEVRLTDRRPGAPRTEFLAHLLQAAENPSSQALAGLRIALDPGHMGGDLWDARTGKYVHDAAGNKVSEGVIALQTALVLEQELRALGAEVMVTRRDLAPVDSQPYESLDVNEGARTELRRDSLTSWFQNLLQAGSPGSALNRAFDRSSAVRRLFSESSRINYFLSADLVARAEAIQAFHPDITLILHYDVLPTSGDGLGVNPRAPSLTKGYVAGAFLPTEFSTRDARLSFAQHLLNPEAWEQSIALGRSVLGSLHSELGLGYDSQGGPGGPVSIEPGVYARNLGLTRMIQGHALFYLETLYYNSPREFAAFRNVTHPLWVNGRNLPYSDRVLEVVGAIRDGVVGFVHAASVENSLN
jgi:N-acetylmuramoyl-L-alanine amidase